MPRTEIPVTLLDPAAGGAIPGAAVRIALRATGSNAVVYAAETGVEVMPNPMTSDQFGRVNGWLDEGRYVAQISGAGLYPTDEPFDSTPADLIPPGAMFNWPGATPPPGYWACDGTTVAAATNPKLAGLLPTALGQVTLPELVGRVIVGAGTGFPLRSRAGLAAVTLGVPQIPNHDHPDDIAVINAPALTTGTESADHSHAISIAAADAGRGFRVPVTWPGYNFTLADGPSGAYPRVGLPANAPFTTDAMNHQHSASAGGRTAAHSHQVPIHGHGLSGKVGFTGGGGSHENMQPYEAFLPIIRAG